MSKIRLVVATIALPALLSLAPARASTIAQPSLYAVNAAALASAMTFCSTKYNGMMQGSPGATCFAKARLVLANFELKRRSEEIDAACSDPAKFNTCLTPQIGRLVYALNAEFAKQAL